MIIIEVDMDSNKNAIHFLSKYTSAKYVSLVDTQCKQPIIPIQCQLMTQFPNRFHMLMLDKTDFQHAIQEISWLNEITSNEPVFIITQSHKQ